MTMMCTSKDLTLLTYLISFDNETGLFSAKSINRPLIIGQGKSLNAAIDELEMNLDRKADHDDRLNVNLVFEEKQKDEIELTAKLSITV